MKFTLINAFLLLFGSLVSNAVYSTDFKLGEHYNVVKGMEVKGKTSSEPTITEFFSFYCPHCYKFEPFVYKVKKLLPSPKQFVKNHVDGMPGRDINTEHMLTKALATATLLNMEKTVIPGIFTYIHKSRADFSSLQDVKNIFLLNGADGATFDKTFNSFKVKMMANTMRNKTQKMRKQGFSAVPTFVINGKFVPNIKSVKSMDEYLELIKYLLTKTI